VPPARQHPAPPAGPAPRKSPKPNVTIAKSQMLDARREQVTDFGHENRDEPDVIMTKIREECGRRRPAAGQMSSRTAAAPSTSRTGRGFGPT